MHTPTMLASLLPLLPLAVALPFESRAANEMAITALSASLPTSGSTGTGPRDASLSITVSYPDATGAALTTTCSYGWPASTAPGATEWTACADSSLQWRLPASGFTSATNYLVEIFQTQTAEGAGLDASHILKFAPGQSSDPDAYLSCIQMGKFNPLTCNLNGPLSGQRAPVVMLATEQSVRPN